MKKSIIFGILAMFAVSALSVQNVNAQTVVTKPEASKQENLKSDEKIAKPNADPTKEKDMQKPKDKNEI